MKRILYFLGALFLFMSCNQEVVNKNEVREYVDLGLSVKWGDRNMGANAPEVFGDFYAWGETVTKDEYTKKNCLTYGLEIDVISGDSQYDVARKEWGGTWRLPTNYEMTELVTNCIFKRSIINNVVGYFAIGPNGNRIFLPASGYYLGSKYYYKKFFGGKFPVGRENGVHHVPVRVF